MATRKTWIWIIVGVAGVCVIALLAVAGAGVYFVAHHVQTEDASNADAMRSFDAVRATFKEQRALYEIDAQERPRAARTTQELPTSPVKPQDLRILAFDPEKQRLVKVSLPFWLLRLGKQKIDVMNGDRGFDLERLNLDVAELERIGPALVFDFRNHEGVRVLLWTQ